MVGNGRRNAENGRGMDGECRKWPGMARNGQRWSEMSGDGRKWPGMGHILDHIYVNDYLSNMGVEIFQKPVHFTDHDVIFLKIKGYFD